MSNESLAQEQVEKQLPLVFCCVFFCSSSWKKQENCVFLTSPFWTAQLVGPFFFVFGLASSFFFFSSTIKHFCCCCLLRTSRKMKLEITLRKHETWKSFYSFLVIFFPYKEGNSKEKKQKQQLRVLNKWRDWWILDFTGIHNSEILYDMKHLQIKTPIVERASGFLVHGGQFRFGRVWSSIKDETQFQWTRDGLVRHLFSLLDEQVLGKHWPEQNQTSSWITGKTKQNNRKWKTTTTTTQIVERTKQKSQDQIPPLVGFHFQLIMVTECLIGSDIFKCFACVSLSFSCFLCSFFLLFFLFLRLEIVFLCVFVNAAYRSLLFNPLFFKYLNKICFFSKIFSCFKTQRYTVWHVRNDALLSWPYTMRYGGVKRVFFYFFYFQFI